MKYTGIILFALFIGQVVGDQYYTYSCLKWVSNYNINTNNMVGGEYLLDNTIIPLGADRERCLSCTIDFQCFRLNLVNRDFVITAVNLDMKTINIRYPDNYSIFKISAKCGNFGEKCNVSQYYQINEIDDDLFDNYKKITINNCPNDVEISSMEFFLQHSTPEYYDCTQNSEQSLTASQSQSLTASQSKSLSESESKSMSESESRSQSRSQSGYESQSQSQSESQSEFIPKVCNTLYAYNDRGVCFRDISKSDNNKKKLSNWGWSHDISDFDSTMDFILYAGAGKCDLDKGSIVGTLTLSKNETGYDIEYNITSEGLLTETHVYIGDTILPKKNNKYKASPGLYGNEHNNIYSKHDEFTILSNENDVWFVGHGVICSMFQ